MTLPLLEVIVASVEDAREAERGGAGRLEVVRDLARDGFTPALDTVREIVEAVRVPVRVMVRETAAHEVGPQDVARLAAQAAALAALPIDGIVLGFVHDGRVDLRSLRAVLAAAPSARATFHRAFESLAAPLEGAVTLRGVAQVDRILWSGGEGDWGARRARLVEVARQAGPRLGVIVGGGLTLEGLDALAGLPELREFHVGRAAREPARPDAPVRAPRVAALVEACRRPAASAPDRDGGLS